MLETLRNAWKIKEIRNKILFTVFIVLIFRIGSVIQHFSAVLFSPNCADGAQNVQSGRGAARTDSGGAGKIRTRKRLGQGDGKHDRKVRRAIQRNFPSVCREDAICAFAARRTVIDAEFVHVYFDQCEAQTRVA